ncbi:hypothetical protein ACWIW6_02180 [Ursidibacter sp. B-7004-1]
MALGRAKWRGFAAINRPTSGATFDLTLPQGNKVLPFGVGMDSLLSV